ncbi:hypothetical protein JI57_04785, partial [Psychromonas sp. PRT-SC03]
MKRFLLSIIFCSPFLLSSPLSLAINLIGPNGERAISVEQYGPISNVETLWAISSKLRPDKSVSVLQTLAAIYKLNPEAFTGGNINQIIPQSMIQIPSLEMISLQTNKEASSLLKKYSRRNSSSVVIKKSIKPRAPIKEENIKTAEKKLKVKAPVTPKVESLPVKKEQPILQNTLKSTEAQARIKSLQTELEIINEEFLLSEETNQKLKLKLQPLHDQLNTSAEQNAKDQQLLEDKQKKINELEEQLLSKVESAFSGAGILNETLRFITSSLAHLLVVIISPVLLLLAGLVLFMRMRNKRELAKEEQELAESTVTLMETSEGLFDELLTEYNVEDDIELDFSAEEESTEEITLSDESEMDVDVVDLSMVDEDEPQKEIVEPTIEEDLIDEVNFDASDVETSEEDPFGIGALVDLEEEVPNESDSLVGDIFGKDVKKSD